MSGHADTHGPGSDALNLWWELSYAQYLTIPRTVMQSMPDKWQGKMAALLNELDERIEWRPENAMYWVDLREIAYDRHDQVKRGRKLTDPLADYERGRRRIGHPQPGASE